MENKYQISNRLIFLDAFRGFIMLMMCASHGFGFEQLSERPGLAGEIAVMFTHIPWGNGHFLDLVQPAFMFIVGVAMPLSFALREKQGQTFGQMFRHVLWRAVVLIFLSQIIVSIAKNELQFQLINVLSQIAFTYFFCFLIMQLKFFWQILIAVLILVFHWSLFAMFPGFAGSYSQLDNIGAVIDRAILGKNYPGYYVTINFMSSTVTTLFGVWTGMLMMRKTSHSKRVKILIIASITCLVIGFAMKPIIPINKRLWTESFTFYSTGWVLVMLLIFYWLAEIRKYYKLVFPFIVVGLNSIFIYCVAMVLYPWIDNALAIFTKRFAIIGDFGILIQAIFVLMALWYLCFWLYQRKIFFKI